MLQTAGSQEQDGEEDLDGIVSAYIDDKSRAYAPVSSPVVHAELCGANPVNPLTDLAGQPVSSKTH